MVINEGPLATYRKLADIRKAIKLVKPSSTVYSAVPFKMLPEESFNSERSHHGSLHPQAARSCLPAGKRQPHISKGCHHGGHEQAESLPHMQVGTILYMHGPRPDATTANFHWATYSMTTGKPSSRMIEYVTLFTFTLQAPLQGLKCPSVALNCNNRLMCPYGMVQQKYAVRGG